MVVAALVKSGATPALHAAHHAQGRVPQKATSDAAQGEAAIFDGDKPLKNEEKGKSHLSVSAS